MNFSVMGKTIKLLLNQLGFSEIDVCTTSISAAENLANTQYTSLIWDIEMSPVNGIDLVRELQNSGRYTGLHILMTTASSRRVTEIKGISDLRIDGLVTKPFALRDLRFVSSG